MKTFKSFFSVVVSLAVLVLLAVGLILLLRSPSESHPTAQERTTGETTIVITPPSPTITEMPPISTAWETATLEQIHFGPPQIILTHTYTLRIVDWISNEELLVLRDLTQGRTQVAIEVLNVTTGAVTRLAEGQTVSRPVWLSARKGAAYLAFNPKTKQRDLLISTMSDQTPQTIYEGAFLPLLASPDGQSAIILSADKQLRQVGYAARALVSDFSPFAVPVNGAYELSTGTAQSPYNKWAAVYNSEHFTLVNPTSGETREIDLAKAQVKAPIWAMEADWSPDGQQVAIIATYGLLPNKYRYLLVFDVQSDTIRQIPLPQEFVLSDLIWAPNNRFLLAQGMIATLKNGQGLDGYLLIDTTTNQTLKINLLPPGAIGGFGTWSLAWSPDNWLVAFLCFTPGQGHSTLCTAKVEVK